MAVKFLEPKKKYPWNKGKKTGLVPKTAFKKGEHPSPKTEFKKGVSASPNTQFKKGRGKQQKGKLNPNWKGGYENKLMLNRKRRILKKGNGGSHTLGEWETLKAQYNWTCYFCEKCEPEITLTEDHIIPLSRGGTDNIENIQPLCVSCNSKKGTKTIQEWIAQKEKAG